MLLRSQHNSANSPLSVLRRAVTPARIVCRVACAAIVCLLVSACDSGSSPATTTSGQTTSGQTTSNSDTAGATTSGASTNGGADNGAGGVTGGVANDDSTGGATDVGGGSSGIARPALVSLSTLEESAIDGEFSLIGESAGSQFSEQFFSIITQPANGSVIHNDGARQFTYAPRQDFFGEDSFVYGIASGLSATVVIDVENVNDAPVIFDDVQRVIEQGTVYSELLNASDPDGDVLDFAASNLPPWLQLDNRTGVLSGTPTQLDVGLFENIAFRVIDPDGLFSEVDGIRIEVIDINDAPTINTDQFPAQLDANESISVNLYPDDPDGDLVKLAVEPNDFLSSSVNGSTVTIVASDVTDVTDVNLVIVATDLRGRERREIVPLVLHPMNSSGRGRTLFGRKNGEGIHLVVLGDGYRQDQLESFRTHVEDLVVAMQSDPGMARHFSAWNVHMVETPSIDSGIDDNMAVDSRDTVFNTGYFCRDIPRLICGDQLEMYEVAIDEYPNFDQIVVLVNDLRYGGSGGNVAISSVASLEVALHEMGHSIAGLADEYVDSFLPDAFAPDYVEGAFANVSNNSDPALVPWSHWLNAGSVVPVNDTTSQVGVFEGAFYQANGFFRPTRDSLMRSYEGQLGPVNSEQWALSVYTMANPVLDLSPINRDLSVQSGDDIAFSVFPLFDSTVQLVEWRLDDQLIAHSGGRQPAVRLRLPIGDYSLTLKVKDVSGLIRKPEPHQGVFNWQWNLEVR